MADFVKMPTLGFDMEEGTMGAWMKNVGDTIAKGDILAEIESDKVTQELAARSEGVLLAQLTKQGDIVPVGANLAIIGAAGEDISGMTSDDAPAADPAPVATEAAPEAATPAPAAETAPAPVAASGDVKATPVARRIASENGVNLNAVVGSGPGGRIRKADVEAAIANPPAAASASKAVAFKPATVPTGPETTEVPLTRLRQAIARRMTESKTTIPQFYVTSAIHMDAAFALRKQVNAALPEGEKVSVNDLIVKAAGLALRQFPNLNASFNGDSLVLHNRVHVGSAVAVEGGLLTIVQRDTDVSPLRQVAAENREKIGRARDGKVQADDIGGSTFSVSNLGAWEVDHFIAIVNPPEAAILAIGSAITMPVVVDGELTVGKVMKVTLSADHRVTDGAEAAQFLQYFKQVMETPLRLMM